ncbi:MAG: monovalent cation/H(+) antiporter subunit G [Alphaproteobacteria bacterium]|nr:monovalent cation/H(+) antiporter subunit G [Alphaproteobacteria bacterium]
MTNEIIGYIGDALILAGAFFVFTGAMGLVRFPDFFTRLHAAGVVDSLGLPLVILGLALHAGFTLTGGKLLLLLGFVLLISPTACHALAKAAFLAAETRESQRSKLLKRDVPRVDKSAIGEQER